MSVGVSSSPKSIGEQAVRRSKGAQRHPFRADLIVCLNRHDHAVQRSSSPSQPGGWGGGLLVTWGGQKNRADPTSSSLGVDAFLATEAIGSVRSVDRRLKAVVA